MSSEQPLDNVTVRRATTEDTAVCGQICFDAFNTINQSHGFPSDFPSVDVATQFISTLFSHPGFYCVVAESDGRIVGSNCLDERSTITGVGPVTIDPQLQNRGAGRLLMQAVLDRATERRAAGVRLVQAAFHNRSLSLYASLGFDIREPLSCMQGRTVQRTAPGCKVRPAQSTDIDASKTLALQVHGFDRGQELVEGIEHGTAVLVERGGRITGYSSLLGSFGHSTAETNLDLQALIASADSFAGAGILVPSRNSALLRWCLANGLRVTQPMTLMTNGSTTSPKAHGCPPSSINVTSCLLLQRYGRNGTHFLLGRMVQISSRASLCRMRKLFFVTDAASWPPLSRHWQAGELAAALKGRKSYCSAGRRKTVEY